MLNLKNKSFSSLVKPSILILISGIFIRLVTALWPQSLSSDEQVSLYFAQINLVESFLRDNSAPLFSLLLRIWQNLVPISESALRLLPFLISTLTLIYVWKRWNEFWVRFLFVINPASISFAGDLKNTALFELFTVIFISESLHLFKLFKDHKRIEPRRYAIIFLVSAVLIFTHYLGLLLIFSGLLGLVLWKPIATELRLKIIFFIIVSGLLMFGINYYWLHSQSLVWMQNFHKEDGSLLFLLPPYVLGSYSRTWAIFLFGLILWNAVKKKSIESIWCVGLLILYFAVEYITDRNLGFRRFLVPLQVLSILSIAAYFPINWAKSRWLSIILIWGLAIQVKKIIEDISWPKSGWKQASEKYCLNDAKNPIQIFSHDGQIFYFPLTCATIVKSCPVTFAKISTWIVQKQVDSDFRKLIKSCPQPIQMNLTETVAESSFEPILVYELTKRE